jgi:succinate-semialdehyde dehydrogenase/glutarate-semialdehyde dehydrogenase
VRTVTEHVDDALEKGGVITATAQRFVGSAKGQFFPPMVIERVNETMVTMQRETFGPVVAVQCVADLDEAVTRANDSFLGLTASVWTRNRRKAHRIAARLEAGTVTVNDHLMSHGLAETPWGGFKQSGIGRTHGCLGLEEMTQPRVVVDDILPAVQKNMWWYPHSKKVYDGLLGVLPLLYGRGIAQRLRGGARVLGTFARTFQKD